MCSGNMHVQFFKNKIPFPFLLLFLFRKQLMTCMEFMNISNTACNLINFVR